MKDFIVSCLYENVCKHYSDFSGTMGRGEFWRFMIVLYCIHGFFYAASGLLSLIDGMYLYAVSFYISILLLFCLALTLPLLGAMARRLNDSNNSPWLLLLGLIPYVGPVILLILFLLGSKPRTQAAQTAVDMSEQMFLQRLSRDNGAGHDIATGQNNDEDARAQLYRSGTGRDGTGHVGKSIILVVMTVCFCAVGATSLSHATDKELEALHTMSPGTLTSMVDETLNGPESPYRGQNLSTWDAKDALENFHSLLQQERYEEAYRLMGQRRREEYGTMEQWRKSAEPYHEKEIAIAELHYVEIDEYDPKPRLYFDVYYMGCEYPSRCMIVMVYENESWRVEGIYPFDEEE